jgi:hypothetical protein
MISIPHKTKQFLVLLIKLLIVGAAFYFIYNQLANRCSRLGEVHYFIQEESVGSRHYFHSAFECLESFFEILKWQNLVSFHKISKQGNKTSPRCLDGWTIYSNGIEYAGKAMFFDKSATKKVLFLT